MVSSIILCFCCVAALVAVSGAAVHCPPGWHDHSNACYHLSHDSEDWRGAAYICKLIGGYLIEIGSADEESFVLGLAKNASIWTGANDLVEEGIWQWMTSQDKIGPNDYTQWAPREPSNGSGEENCVYINYRGDKQWHDDRCTNRHFYVCESHPAR